MKGRKLRGLITRRGSIIIKKGDYTITTNIKRLTMIRFMINIISGMMPRQEVENRYNDLNKIIIVIPRKI